MNNFRRRPFVRFRTRCGAGDPDGAVEACSALIQSGQDTGIILAAVFYDRGLARAHEGDYDLAIEDYDQAIRLHACSANAFLHRSLACRRKGDYLRAMSDRGHFLWLKFGILGITIRLCILAFVLALAIGFNCKRFRKGQMRGKQN